jgi:opacity protein-like surface antigen
MRHIARLIFLFLLLSALPALARAATTPAPATATPTATPPATRTTGMLIGIDGMSATVMQQGQSSFSGLGLRARLHPARLAAGFELLPSVEYWRNTTRLDAFGIKTGRKDATLGCDAVYHFTTRNFRPYLGAGYGIHFLSSDVEVTSPTLAVQNGSDSVVKGGVAALAGASFGISPRIDNFIEVKYHHLPGFSQVKINWGLAYNF